MNNDTQNDQVKSTRGETPKRLRVVVADDVPGIIEAVEERLSPEYEIVGRASDGITLVDQVQQLLPDIVVTDISMPLLSGMQAVREIRNRGLAIPAVILSVHEDPGLAQEALANGVSAFVLKSRLQEDLRTAIQEALAGRKFVSERLRRNTNTDSDQD